MDDAEVCKKSCITKLFVYCNRNRGYCGALPAYVNPELRCISLLSHTYRKGI